jgi:hypothetical protein
MNSIATTTIVPLSAAPRTTTRSTWRFGRTTTRSTWQELPCKEMSNVELFAVIATDLKGMRIEAAAELLLRAERKTR